MFHARPRQSASDCKTRRCERGVVALHERAATLDYGPMGTVPKYWHRKSRHAALLALIVARRHRRLAPCLAPAFIFSGGANADLA